MVKPAYDLAKYRLRSAMHNIARFRLLEEAGAGATDCHMRFPRDVIPKKFEVAAAIETAAGPRQVRHPSAPV
jgi:hypothetical protein